MKSLEQKIIDCVREAQSIRSRDLVLALARFGHDSTDIRRTVNKLGRLGHLLQDACNRWHLPVINNESTRSQQPRDPRRAMAKNV